MARKIPSAANLLLLRQHLPKKHKVLRKEEEFNFTVL